LLTLPGYRNSYNDRNYLPKSVPANVGYAAASDARGHGRAHLAARMAHLLPDFDIASAPSLR